MNVDLHVLSLKRSPMPVCATEWETTVALAFNPAFFRKLGSRPPWFMRAVSFHSGSLLTPCDRHPPCDTLHGAQDPNFLKKAVLKAKAPPKSILAKLLPYQEEGYGWMLEQEKTHRGGILADEMGMGKVRTRLRTQLPSITMGDLGDVGDVGAALTSSPVCDRLCMGTWHGGMLHVG